MSSTVDKNGVPQGSVLGPLSFLLYINDIQFCSELVSIVLFADDTNNLFSHTCLKKLNEVIQIEMNKITDWLKANKLSINAGKPNLYFLDQKIRNLMLTSKFQ